MGYAQRYKGYENNLYETNSGSKGANSCSRDIIISSHDSKSGDLGVARQHAPIGVLGKHSSEGCSWDASAVYQVCHLCTHVVACDGNVQRYVTRATQYWKTQEAADQMETFLKPEKQI